MPYHIAGGKRDTRVPIAHNEILHHLDGNPTKIGLIDNSPDGRFAVRIGRGRAVNSKMVPTRFRRQGNKGVPMYDVDNGWGGLIVTERFKEIVESFEPDVHQFFPFQVEQGGKVIANRHLFFICNRLDTLAKEHCVPPVADGEFYNPVFDGNDKRVYDSAKIGNHHAWCDRFSGGTMVSDALFEAFAIEDFTGLSGQKFDQI